MRVSVSAGVVLSLLSVGVSAFTPEFKWAQDVNNLWLTVKKANCVEGSVNFVVSRDTVSFSCDSANGETAEFNFELRETADPDGLKNGCVARPGNVYGCTIVKSEPHYFDKLVTDDDAERLKSYLSIDWGRWTEDDDQAVPGLNDDPYDPSVDEYIVSLSGEELDETVREHGRVVVDMWFPWCSVCANHRKHYIEAARRIHNGEGAGRGKAPLFARIDLRENRDVATAFDARCQRGFQDHFNDTEAKPCGLIILSPTEDAVFLEERTTVDELTEALLGYSGETVTILETADDVASFRAAADVTVIASLDSQDSPAYPNFLETARALRGKFPCAAAVTEEARAALGDNVASPGIVLFKPEADGERAVWPHDSIAAASPDDIAQWVEANRRALIGEYNWGVREPIDAAGLPIAQIFVDDEAEDYSPETLAETLQPFEKAANTFRGQLVFLYMRQSIAGYMKDEIFGSEHKKLPAFGIVTAFDGESKKYGYKGKKKDTSIEKWCRKFLDGKLKPSYKSQPVPEMPMESGMINQAVQRSIADLDGSNDILLALYKPWGEEYKSMQKALRVVAAATYSVGGFYVAEMDTTANYVDKDMFKGFIPHDPQPMLFFIKGSTLKASRVKASSQGKILTALKKKCAAVKSAWTTVKDEVLAMKEREKTAKAELQRMLAEAVDVDITEDGGIKKKTLREGQGDPPSPGNDIEAHYTGTLEDGTKFDSSRDRGTPFTFQLGKSQVIPCWDKAFATMSVGERAMLTCTSDYAYGDSGSPPTIPGGATLQFDVEMIGYSGVPGGDHSEL